MHWSITNAALICVLARYAGGCLWYVLLECGLANDRTAVQVFVSLPLVGRLIGYQGELQPELPANP